MPKISRSGRRKENHIKRPMNSFMIWGTPIRAEIKLKNPHLLNLEISKILGAKWRKMPKSEKAYYTKLSKELAAQHQAKYPNYRFRPIRRNPKNKKRTLSTSSSESEDEENEETSAAISMPLTPPTPPVCSTSLSPGSSNPNAYHPNGYQAAQGQSGYYGMAHGVPQMMTHYPLSANVLDTQPPNNGQFQAQGSYVAVAGSYFHQNMVPKYEGVYPSPPLGTNSMYPTPGSCLGQNSPVIPGTQHMQMGVTNYAHGATNLAGSLPTPQVPMGAHNYAHEPTTLVNHGLQQMQMLPESYGLAATYQNMQITPPIYGQGATYPVNPLPAIHAPALRNYAQTPTTFVTTPTVGLPAQQVQMAPSSYPQGETNWGATPMLGSPQVAVSAIPSPNDQSTTGQFTQLQNRPYPTSEMVGNGINGGQSYYGGAHDNYYYP